MSVRTRLLLLVLASCALVTAGCRRLQQDATPIGFAVGKAENGESPIEVVVSMGMPRREAPVLKYGILQWEDWIRTHFDLRDESGKQVPLRKANFAKLISDAQAMNPEFFLAGSLKPGKYRFNYIPVLGEGRKYVYEFKVDPAGLPFARYDFVYGN